VNPYASVVEMKARYPEKDLRELTDEEAESINDDRLATALASASATIDSYLIGRYRLPLASVPLVLIDTCCTIAMYNLQSLRPGTTVDDVRDRYKDAIAYLTQVAVGKAQLSLDAVDAVAAQTDGPMVVTATKTFGRDNMKGF
jgi:phage gp36-like protein